MKRKLKGLGVCIVGILLVIVVVMIYKSRDIADVGGTQSGVLAIPIYNEMYANYVGSKVKGSIAKQLTIKIASHNSDKHAIDLYGTIEIIYNNENDCNKIIDLIKSNKYYMVEIVEYHESGTISKISIRDYETESGNII